MSAEPATWEQYPAKSEPTTWEMIARAELNVIRELRKIVRPAVGKLVQSAVVRIEQEMEKL